VLRMPEALPTGVAELDRAYAVVQSPDVVRTAKSLCDSLVSRCGFDVESVGDAFRVHREASAQGRLPVSAIPVSAPVAAEACRRRCAARCSTTRGRGRCMSASL